LAVARDSSLSPLLRVERVGVRGFLNDRNPRIFPLTRIALARNPTSTRLAGRGKASYAV